MDTGGDGDQDPDDIDDDLNGDEDVEEDEKSDSDSSTNNREPSMKSVVLRNSNRLASKMKKRDSSKALKSIRTSIKPDRNQLVKRIVVSDPLPYLQTLGQKSVDAFFLKIDDQQVPFEDRNNHINEGVQDVLDLTARRNSIMFPVGWRDLSSVELKLALYA
jgi:hypothetical protein